MKSTEPMRIAATNAAAAARDALGQQPSDSG
jgi:hypothetical protein